MISDKVRTSSSGAQGDFFTCANPQPIKYCTIARAVRCNTPCGTG